MLAFGLAIIVSPKLAGAHAEFLGSKPLANAALATSPSEVALTFSEGVSPLFLKIVDAAGSEVSGLGPVEGIDREVRVRIPKALPDGRYLVSFQVISGDSHPVGSSFPFSVGDLSAGSAAANVPNRHRRGVHGSRDNPASGSFQRPGRSSGRGPGPAGCEAQDLGRRGSH